MSVHGLRARMAYICATSSVWCGVASSLALRAPFRGFSLAFPIVI